MTSPLHTSADLAARFGVDRRTIREKATALGLGIAFGGRAGYRYTDDDVTELETALRPAAPVEKRRRRSA